jgi:hypothetical protein
LALVVEENDEVFGNWRKYVNLEKHVFFGEIRRNMYFWRKGTYMFLHQTCYGKL